jgi:hypothetical protein
VYGVRSDRTADSLFKRITAQGFYRFMRFLGADMVYNHADFRLMGRDALEALSHYTEANLFLRGIIPMLGYKTGIEYYARAERRAGTSKYPPGKMLKFAVEGITSFSIQPLRMITLFGIALFTVSIAMIVYFFARYFSGYTVTGWASTICSLWGIGGIILFCETLELFVTRICESKKLRALLITFLITGALLCVIALLPPVQNALFTFVDTRIFRRDAGGTLTDRLSSLLSLPFAGFIVCVLLLCCSFSKRIAAFLEEADNKKKITIVLSGLIVLMLIFITVFSYRHGRQWLDSDHSSEMVLGKLLAEENVLVSRSWYYSTELRLIYQTIFTMPLFKLLGGLGNWALIRAINIFLNNAVLIAACVFMMKQLKIQNKWAALAGLLLLLPVSKEYCYLLHFRYRFHTFDNMRFENLQSAIMQKNRPMPCVLPEVFWFCRRRTAVIRTGIIWHSGACGIGITVPRPEIIWPRKTAEHLVPG